MLPLLLLRVRQGVLGMRGGRGGGLGTRRASVLHAAMPRPVHIALLTQHRKEKTNAHASSTGTSEGGRHRAPSHAPAPPSSSVAPASTATASQQQGDAAAEGMGDVRALLHTAAGAGTYFTHVVSTRSLHRIPSLRTCPASPLMRVADR